MCVGVGICIHTLSWLELNELCQLTHMVSPSIPGRENGCDTVTMWEFVQCRFHHH